MKELNPGSYLCIIGTKCNNRCAYCYNQFNGSTPESEMSLKVFEQAVKFYQSHPAGIALIGGEPLMYWDTLQYEKNLPLISKTAHQNNNDFRMVSNGTLLDQKKLQFISDYGIKMDISLDGTKECHDRYRRSAKNEPTYDLAKQAIENLLTIDSDLRIRGTVHQSNAYKYVDMYNGILSFGNLRNGLEPESFDRWSPYNLNILSKNIEIVIFDYMERILTSKQRFMSFDRILFQIYPELSPQSGDVDTNWARVNSIAMLANGDLSVNHNFVFRADVPPDIFTVGNVFDGYDEQKIDRYLSVFEDLDANFFYASNEETTCKSCAAYNMCRNPWNTESKVGVWNKDTYANGACISLSSIANSIVKFINNFGGIEKYIFAGGKNV